MVEQSIDSTDQSPATGEVSVVNAPAHEWHRLGNPVRIASRTWLFEVCKYLPPKMKHALYRRTGVGIGERTILAPHVQVDPYFPEKIDVGEGTVVGWGTKLLTHEAYHDEWHVGPLEIGDGAVVAAHSFVDRDVEPEEKVGGVPIETL